MTDQTPKDYSLPEVLDSTAAGPLLADLQKMRGNPVQVVGGAVSRISALCVQVLLSAEKTWKADGVPFCVSSPSDALREALRILGVSDDQLTASGALT